MCKGETGLRPKKKMIWRNKGPKGRALRRMPGKRFPRFPAVLTKQPNREQRAGSETTRTNAGWELRREYKQLFRQSARNSNYTNREYDICIT